MLREKKQINFCYESLHTQSRYFMSFIKRKNTFNKNNNDKSFFMLGNKHLKSNIYVLDKQVNNFFFNLKVQKYKHFKIQNLDIIPILLKNNLKFYKFWKINIKFSEPSLIKQENSQS